MASEPIRGEILFHHPFPIAENPGAGSQLRPARMIKAFEDLGYDVTRVTGHSPERVRTMRRIAREIRAGRRFEFCYAESVTSPTALSDPRHLPLHPLADPAFFRTLRSGGVPVGLFYRDVHWRFDQYTESVPLHKRLVAATFYHWDLLWYSRSVDVLYLPDLGMADSVPGAQRFNLRSLPPGCDVDAGVARGNPAALPTAAPLSPGQPGRLRLFYIGSISPPHNDISPLLRAVSLLPEVELTISFPRAELERLSAYETEWLEGVEIVHLNALEAVPYYAAADALCLIYTAHSYRDFAMPVKLFEAIGHGTPTISNDDTAAGRFVATHDLGWTFDRDAGPVELLGYLANNPELVTLKSEHVRECAPAQTWTARAAAVARDLGQLR